MSWLLIKVAVLVTITLTFRTTFEDTCLGKLLLSSFLFSAV